MEYLITYQHDWIAVYRQGKGLLWQQLGSSWYSNEVPVWHKCSIPYFNANENVVAEHINALLVFKMFNEKKVDKGVVKLFALSL